MCFDSLWYILFGLIVLHLFVKWLTIFTMGRVKSNACLAGKTALITGGNSGLGYQTAVALAGRGARVIIADKDDATLSKETIIEKTNNSNIVTKIVDLSSLESVRNFAKDINKTEERLDILINNAGIGSSSKRFSKDGLDYVMQVNHFGGFLLTHLLIDLLKKSAPSRIIFTSSIAAFTNDLALKTLESPESHADGDMLRVLSIYGNSKLCNIISANGFAAKLQGTGITSNSVYPGLVKTPIFNSVPNGSKSLLFLTCRLVVNIYGKSAYEGAQTIINCAVSNKLRETSGKYFIDCKPFFQPPKARSKDLCEEIWKRSEQLVHLEPSERIVARDT